MAWTRKELERMARMDWDEVDAGELKDLKELDLNLEGSPKERMEQLMEQIGNPFLFRWGDFVVKVAYEETEAALEDRLEEFLERMEEGQ